MVLKKTSRFYSDRKYLEKMFPLCMGYKLDLDNPQTYSEKLQWQKLYDHRPEYTKMVDKAAVKDYVANIIGNEYIIPTLGIWDNPEEIEWDKLPDKFVLKCTHDSGGLVICHDKSKLDKTKAINTLQKSLRNDYFLMGREWPYKNVPRRIIAEEYISPSPNMTDLPDYKFFCFDGKVKALFVATERQKPGEEVKFDFFDANYNPLPFRQGHDHAKVLPQRPQYFEQMKKAAEQLSKGLPQIRVDFYETEEKILFGELTLFHFSGLTPFEPLEWDFKFGEWFQLPQKNV